jgi:hypothetical protein
MSTIPLTSESSSDTKPSDFNSALLPEKQNLTWVFLNLLLFVLPLSLHQYCFELLKILTCRPYQL